jgi:hypothetical protein
MKHLFRNISLGILLLALPLTPGMTCTPSQQSIAYKTIYSLEVSTRAAFDAYLDEAIKKVPPDTNGVTKAAIAFNTFQASAKVAIAAAEGNANAPATPLLQDAAAKAVASFK